MHQTSLGPGHEFGVLIALATVHSQIYHKMNSSVGFLLLLFLQAFMIDKCWFSDLTGRLGTALHHLAKRLIVKIALLSQRQHYHTLYRVLAQTN